MTFRLGTGKSITCFYNVYDNVVFCFYCAGESADRDEPLDAGQAARGPRAQGHGTGDRQGLPRDAQRRHRHQGKHSQLYIPSIHGTDGIRKTPSDDGPIGVYHRLNMKLDKLDLQSLFGLHVHSCTRWLRPRNAPPPRIWPHIRGRYWSANTDDISL